MRLFWLLLGLLCVALGTLGIFVPLLPTVVFLLIAAFCFARSSERLHQWLTNHRIFGPPIEDWQRTGSISRKSKVLATISIALSPVIASWGGAPNWAIWVLIAILLAVLLFIWTRPE